MGATGWAESFPETGLRKDHRLSCKSSRDRKHNRKCGCPYSCWIPNPSKPKGRERVRFWADSLKAAIAEKARLTADRLATARTASTDETITHDWFGRCFRGPWKELSPATVWLRDHSYRTYIAPYWQHVKVREINADGVEDWIERLKAEHGTGRKIEAAYETLRVALGIWCKRRSLPNPVVAIDHPRGKRKGYRSKHRRLTRPQYEQLKYSCATPDGLALVRLACECCLRRGELMGLQKHDFHLDATPPYIHVRRRVWDDNLENGEVDIGPLKNGEERYAIVPASLTGVLRPLIAALPRTDSFLFSAWGKNHSQPVKSASMQQRIARIIEKAGLVDENGKRLTSLHGLRATGITLGAAESSVRLAQQQAGHSDSRVTQAHYLGDTELSELHQRSSFAAVFDMPFESRPGESG